MQDKTNGIADWLLYFTVAMISTNPLNKPLW